jgi:hypothetical protein
MCSLPVKKLPHEEEAGILFLHDVVLRLPAAAVQAHLPTECTAVLVMFRNSFLEKISAILVMFRHIILLYS